MDDPHIKAFDNIADRLDRLETLTTGIAGHLRYYEETKTAGDICGRLFGLNFPIHIRDGNPSSESSTIYSNVFLDAMRYTDGRWRSSIFEESLTEQDYRTYLSDAMHKIWSLKKTQEWYDGYDNGWCVDFNRGHHPVGSFESYVAGQKLRKSLSEDFEDVLHFGDEVILFAKDDVPLVRHVQEAERLVRAFGMRLLDAEVGVITPEDALMAPYWVFHDKMKTRVVDRENFGKWVHKEASRVLETFHPNMQSQCTVRWNSPRKGLIHHVQWGFWEKDLPSID